MNNSIMKWNFWWSSPEKLGEFKWIERDALKSATALMKSPRIKDIIGVRRAGKTFLMYQIVSRLIKEGVKPEEILYLNFDDPEFKEIKKTISASLEIKPDIKYVFLDEVQNIPGWERDIRAYYDRKEFKQIFVSGSSASLISRDVGKTLTGRHITILVTPFSFKEFISKHNINYKDPFQKEKVTHYLEKFLQEGGFPETLTEEAVTNEPILVNTYNDIVVRDVVSRFGADSEAAKNLAYYLMTNIGSQFSENSVAKSLNMHNETVKKYLAMLSEVFLFYYIKQFSWKVKEQIKKGMKCYSIDTGLRNAVSFKFSDDLGKLAENAALVELKRRGCEAYFWKGKREVDFIVRKGNKLTAINVAYTDTPHKREKEGLMEFKEKYKDAKLVIITKELEQTSEDGIEHVPLWKWLLNEN
ncbi:MAG: ATP-binding protein [Candidatus Diapherotrites archaeon]|uniref:ATP-binding protein n=1 Tax=Candidatus Iainarchaeum sp. TaxID=3101447 RepID=A0A8T4L5F5_9ARCH|nr:ATP-binding protein [Candidatus Diapherotrites archaeon]